MTDKEKIRKEIEKCYSDALERAKIFNTDYWEGKADAYRNVLLQLASLQGEPVSRTPADIEAAMQEVEEKSRAFTEAHQGENTDTILAQMRGEEPVSIWHNMDEVPIKGEVIVVQTKDTFYGVSVQKGGTTYKNRNKDRYIRWAYASDLLNLSNVQRTIKNCEEPVSEDLGEYINELSNQFPEVSFAKLSRIAVRVAKWQKVKTLSDVKKAVTGKAIQFSMDNVEAWGDDYNGNGKTIKLKGRVTFQVSNPESIVDALIKELENDN